MSPYVRTVKTASGATAVQIVHSNRRSIISAGGLILATGFAYFVIGTIRAALELREASSLLTSVLLVSLATWMVVGLVENQLVDRYLYVPAAVIVALSVRLQHATSASVSTIGEGVHPRPSLTGRRPLR